MDLAQATTTTVNTPQVSVPAVSLSFTPTQLVVGFIIIAAVVIAVWIIGNAGNRGYDYSGKRVSGIKGGKVVKRVIEYGADETEI